MAEIDTSSYPKASQNSLVDTLGAIASIKNANETNKLLQQQQVQGQLGIDSAKIDLAHKGYNGLSLMLGSLAQDPRIGSADGPALVQQYANNAVKQGWLSQDQAATALQTMPQDPAQIPQWLQTINTQVLDGQSRFSAIYGSPGTISNGSQVLPVATSPITGVRPIAAPIDATLSPTERSELVPTTDSQGRTVMVTKGNLLTQSGVNPMTAKPEARANQLMLSPNAGDTQKLVPPQNDNPQGGVVTSPSAGRLQAQTQAAVTSAQRYAEDASRESNFQQNIIPLQKAYEAVKSLGTTGMGPGSEQLNEIRSFLVSRGVLNPSDELKSFDEARKYLTQAARANGDTGTNDKLAAAFAGNPNLGISNAAATDVLKTSLSLSRLQNAQVRAFQSTGQGEENYSKWSNTWNSEQDPVAYGFDLMEPAQRAKYIKGLDKPGRERFVKSLSTAVNLGLVQAPKAE